MGEVKSKEFFYENFLEWEKEKIGVVNISGKPSFKITTPQEFGGSSLYLSPEDLFVASINSCLMTTFLYYAQRSNLKIISYKSKAVGKVEIKERKLIFTQIKVFPQITTDIFEKAEELIKKAKEKCLVSNSVKSEVIIEPQIKSG